MTLYLDSASTDDARRAMVLGLVGGVTTNPTLLSQQAGSPLEVLSELTAICPGTVFYQLTASSPEALKDEALRARDIAENIGLKIPCTRDNLALAAELSRTGVVGMTAIFSAEQAYLAGQAGVAFILPYVNRAKRLRGHSPVAAMRAAIAGTHTEIVAASIKSGAEALETLGDGAHHLTLPLALIEAMGHDPLTEQAIDDFRQRGGAIIPGD